MPPALPCCTALDQYYFEHIAVRAVARRRAEYAIQPLKRFFGATPLEHVDIPLCRKYRAYRADTSDSTVRRELGVLQAAANHALRWRRLTADKSPSIELPAESAGRVLWLFKDELAALLESAEKADERVFRFCQIAYHTASRKRAVEALTWDRVDTVNRRIDLQDPDLPKTKKRRPIVPLSESMAGILAGMKDKATTAYVLGNADDMRWPFHSVAEAAGLLELSPQGLRQGGRLTPHILRHSRATHMLQAGKSPWAVANLLGDTLTTVLRVYGHHCPNYLEEAVS